MPRAGGQRVQQLPAGVEPAGRSADRHDRKSLGLAVSCDCRREPRRRKPQAFFAERF